MTVPSVTPPRVAGATEGPVRVLVACDAALTREGVSCLLRTSAGLEVLPPTTCADLGPGVGSGHPVVVVLLLTPGLEAGPQLVEVARLLRTSYPTVGLVVVSPNGDGLVRPLLDLGPRGISFLIDRNIRDLDVLVRAVLNLADGVVTIDADVMEQIAGHTGTPGLSTLTPRELDVLAGVARGLTNPSVAAALRITVKAVEANVTSIFRKLGLEDVPGLDRRLGAALIFLRANGAGRPQDVAGPG
jgi:DNA-binding NarL/FixJ family response regulator